MRKYLAVEIDPLVAYAPLAQGAPPPMKR